MKINTFTSWQRYKNETKNSDQNTKTKQTNLKVNSATTLRQSIERSDSAVTGTDWLVERWKEKLQLRSPTPAHAQYSTIISCFTRKTRSSLFVPFRQQWTFWYKRKIILWKFGQELKLQFLHNNLNQNYE